MFGISSTISRPSRSIDLALSKTAIAVSMFFRLYATFCSEGLRPVQSSAGGEPVTGITSHQPLATGTQARVIAGVVRANIIYLPVASN